MDFDPYHKWLGIAPKDQPPHHYRLLSIDAFESDRDVIDAAANRIMSYLKDIATGDEAAHSQGLLNEVTQARLCLLNRDRKAAYDKELKAKLSAKKPAKRKNPPAQPATTNPAPNPSTLPKSNTPAVVQPVPIGISVQPEPFSVRVEKTQRGGEDKSTPPWLFPAIGGFVLVLSMAILLAIIMTLNRDDPTRPERESGPAIVASERGSSSHEGDGAIGSGIAADNVNSSADPIDVEPTLPPAKVPLFNGVDLTGWQGWVGNPRERANMSSADLAKAQRAADERMRLHWKVEDRALVFDGQGEQDCNLCTVKATPISNYPSTGKSKAVATAAFTCAGRRRFKFGMRPVTRLDPVACSITRFIRPCPWNAPTTRWGNGTRSGSK